MQLSQQSRNPRGKQQSLQRQRWATEDTPRGGGKRGFEGGGGDRGAYTAVQVAPKVSGEVVPIEVGAEGWQGERGELAGRGATRRGNGSWRCG